MLKRNNKHIFAMGISILSSFFLFIWLVITLAHYGKNSHIAIGVLIIISWIAAIAIGIIEYKETQQEFKKITLFTMLIPFLFISIFTSWDLYKKSGKSKKDVNEAILNWEIKNISQYIKLYKNGFGSNKLSKECLTEIALAERLSLKEIVQNYSMGDYVRKLILEDLKIETLATLYTEEDISLLIPE